MIVIGGSYTERCQRPGFDRLRGSGLRAALALKSLTKVAFHSACSAEERPTLESVLGGAGEIDLVALERAAPVVFDYFTPLSPPGINGLGTKAPGRFAASDRTALLFGMIEGIAAPDLSVETLVVDPQGSSGDAIPGGARFQRLGLVANEREVQQLAGSRGVEAAAGALRQRIGADAVVVKCGARGALVATSEGLSSIGCFQTDGVSPIGSGDIFAAAFAWAYGERGDPPVDAARFASRSVAHWCSREDEPSLLAAYDEALPEVGFGPRPTVYIAAPFFGLGQSWLVDLVRSALAELGADPFSPFHDVGVGGPEIAVADLEALDRSMAVLALLDEFDPGTLFEVGYAIRQGIPVVGYLDPRPERHLVMLEGSGVDVVTDLSSAVYRSIWRAMAVR